MGIDIYILNLPRSTHRLTLCREELCARGIPIEKIHTWVANDDWNYEKTRQVCEAAIADGFPKYQSFLDKGQHNKEGIAIFTQSWNYCRFFRHLIETQKDAVLIHDDMKFDLGMTYESLNEVTDFLHSRDELFYFLSLRIDQKIHTKLTREFGTEHRFVFNGVHRNNRSPDTAFVITPQGAELLLSEFEGRFPPRLEVWILNFNQHVGFYSVNVSGIMCHKFIHGTDIFTDDYSDFARPLETTADPDPLENKNR